MKKHVLFLAAMLSSALAGTAVAGFPAPPFFAEAMEYMDAQGIGNACMEMRVRVGKPSEIEVTRSSGDARFDALASKGLHLEIDVMQRFPVDWRKPDAAGWRRVPLKFDRHNRHNTNVLGCAAARASR
jgi:hypothetical protein